MNTCAVTIAGPDRRVDLVVSTETPVAELIPTFVELSVDERPAADAPQPVWAVAPAGRNPLRPERTLADEGISDGDVLTLTEVRPAAAAPPRPARAHRIEPRRGTPAERARATLPEREPGTRRLSLATQAFFGHEPEPIVIESATPTEPTARERLERAEERGARERWRRSWRDTDYIARLDARVEAPRLTRCATIAVVSPKGGVGKTTVTALLGSLLAHVRSDRIVAVDTNPDFGSLGRTLVPEHTVYVDDLLDVLDRPDLSVTALDGHLGRAIDGLMVLPAPTDPQRMAALDEASYRRVIERLQSLVGVLVLDCGTGLQEPAARAAQAAADQILLVSDAHPATASLVAEAAGLLRTVGPPLTVVVNKLPRARELRLDLDELGELVPDAHGLLTIPDDPAAAAGVASGTFTWREAPAGWQERVRELAAVLTADWIGLGLAR